MAGARALLLFARSPEAEARAKGFAAGKAGALFSALASSWAEAARRAGARLIVATPRSCRSRLETLLGSPETAFCTQAEGTFGERLADSAFAAFRHGAGALLVAGIDCPAPRSEELDAAFAFLEGAGGAVLGPAGDGGLYLVGLPESQASLLRSIGLRERDLFERLRAALVSRGLAVRVLHTVADLDGPSDLRRLKSAPGPEAPWAPFRALLDLALAPDRPPERLSLRPAGPALADPSTPRGPPPRRAGFAVA